MATTTVPSSKSFSSKLPLAGTKRKKAPHPAAEPAPGGGDENYDFMLVGQDEHEYHSLTAGTGGGDDHTTNNNNNNEVVGGVVNSDMDIDHQSVEKGRNNAHNNNSGGDGGGTMIGKGGKGLVASSAAADNSTKMKQSRAKLGNCSWSTGEAAALSIATVRNMLQEPREDYRPAGIPFLVNGVDITKRHELWKDELRISSPYNRNSAWWLPYHQGIITDEEGQALKGVGICNICGSLLQLGARSGTSSLTRHLASKHPAVHKAILDALKEGLVLGKFFEDTSVNNNKSEQSDNNYSNNNNNNANYNKKQRGKYAPRIVISQQGGSPNDLGMISEAATTNSNSNSNIISNNNSSKKHTVKQSANTTHRMQKEAAASMIAAKCLDAHVIYAADRNRPFSEFDDPSFHALRHAIAQTALACARIKLPTWATTATTTANNAGTLSTTTAGCFEDVYQLSSRSVHKRANAMAEEIRTSVYEMIDRNHAPIVGVLHHWQGSLLHSAQYNIHSKKHQQQQQQQQQFHTNDRDKKSYASFSIHWIQDFTRKSCVIAVQTGGVSTALCSGLDLEAKLRTWKLGSTDEKSPSFIVRDDDTPGNNDGGGRHYIECLDHKLQKVANVAFTAYLGHPAEGTTSASADYNMDRPPGAEALEVARHLCDYFFEKSESRLEALKAKQNFLKALDKPEEQHFEIIANVVGTQWWSSLPILDRILEYREAISACLSDPEFKPSNPPIRAPSEVEWKTLQALRAVLKPVARATEILEGNNDVTSSLVACLLYEIKEQLQNVSKQEKPIETNHLKQQEPIEIKHEEPEQRDPEIPSVVAVSTVAGQMLEKLNEIMGDFTSDPFCERTKAKEEHGTRHGLDPALIFAHALDPRFKKLKLFDKNIRETIWKRLLAEMVKLRPSATDASPTEPIPAAEGANSQQNDASSSIKEVRPSLGAYAALDNSESEDNDGDESSQDTWKAACEIELSGFKLEKGTKFDASGEPDTLEWWSERIWRFPTMWKLCQVYFAIPATAMPVDRAFRVLGNTTTYNRCELATISMEDALHCIHENKWVMREDEVLPKSSTAVPQDEKEGS
ncbi:hypothetical protein ACA910_005993 [Epithemia clementina (nom. ined.)]